MSSQLLDLPDVAVALSGATFYVVQGGLDKQMPATVLEDMLVPLETAVDALETAVETAEAAIIVLESLSPPPGGTDGQVLTKQSGADGDAAWEDLPASSGGGMFRGNNGTIGTGSGDIFRVNAQTLTEDVTIGATENASATGPIAVETGNTLTVASGGTLVIV